MRGVGVSGDSTQFQHRTSGESQSGTSLFACYISKLDGLLSYICGGVYPTNQNGEKIRDCKIPMRVSAAFSC
jgi:hypothetical protein